MWYDGEREVIWRARLRRVDGLGELHLLDNDGEDGVYCGGDSMKGEEVMKLLNYLIERHWWVQGR
jgi:hypothetical protein